MILLIKNIKWDEEGQQNLDLPNSVLFIGWEKDSEEVSITLSETFGFNHHGYDVEIPKHPDLQLPTIIHPEIKL